ncbi:5-formyltetrahydrofolate cyclo-ligase isoform X3 [Elephas maximus indicus]|uniref:5-formyltetrahydrofolate cyclo-ligase isoform X3 n=1 Tax=Elephas maximus indicus TaxID=99487 RepID=UPI0021163652|nr:5-formyltetrahydrofolate cyclo-ligase isoform X3 [Elephas maximus indicus]
MDISLGGGCGWADGTCGASEVLRSVIEGAELSREQGRYLSFATSGVKTSGLPKVIAHSQYQKSRRISIFLSMQDEIETEEIIKDIFQQGKTCFIPQYQFQSNHMEMVKLASPEEISLLPKTSWNIHQPAEGEVREEALSTGGLDLIFMPGLGFDKHGNRLGRGKGYYDSYLKRCLQQQEVKPYTMALAFKEQICHQVPVDEHDMKVDEVLYEDPSTS